MLPNSIKAEILKLVEEYNRRKVFIKENRSRAETFPYKKEKKGKRILIYHKNALYFGGTERCLQIAAKALSDTYDIFIMYSKDVTLPNRKKEVEEYATLIPFDHQEQEKGYPYFLPGMNPSFASVLEMLEIDLLIVSGPGKTEYPYITETNVPIIQMNNFGAPSVQENIKRVIFVSEEIRTHSQNYTGKRNKDMVLPIPVETSKTKEIVPSLRSTLSIPDDAFIFGRIGRSSDDIYDPIAIEAFKKVVSKNTNAHYVIVSPPPKLRKKVEDEHVCNVHFIETTTDEDTIWSFHYGIDTLAHFRYDGETQGLNICESMYAGKPIISHHSSIWNAHTEYLNADFARIANCSDIDEYASYMEEFMHIKASNSQVWETMCKAAKQKADELFSFAAYKNSIVGIVKELI